MSGCFGGSKEDRYFEKQLDDYLDSQEFGGCQICQEAQAEDTCTICNKDFCMNCGDPEKEICINCEEEEDV